VSVVDPKKNDTIADPACGTAGFLISSYKHILKHNTKKQKGDKLTPDERKQLLNNLVGYDISPDMVRLSLVNMYLHEFPDPKIHEYDTLTSEERWNETYDVILANPPFMTPKGGIRPHKRFSVRAKRSEVLFVDYIAEHLNPNGRGGVIVPEGIIFQSQTAYKYLRKMLVDNYLLAVVSLPAGVFNPYSGVKTSILFMDKTLSKKTDKILFVKIENDGFDLGAQRNPIDKNDLPKALNFIKSYHQAVINGKEVENTDYAHVAEKVKIAESGDWNLSGGRYKDSLRLISLHFKEVELGKVVEVLDSLRKPIKKADRVTGEYPYYGATGILDYVEDYIFNERLVLVGEDGAKWSAGEKTAFIAEGKYWVNNHAHVLRPMSDKLIDTYLVEVFNYLDLNEYITGVTVPKLNQQKLCSIKIPLPPIDVQKAIVAEIDSYQKIIDGARQVVDNYKPTIKIDPDWEIVELGKIAHNLDGKRIPIEKSKRKSGKYPYYGASGIVDYVDNYIFDDDLLLISEDGANLLARVTPIAFSVNGKCWVNNHAHVLKFKKKETQIFVEIYLNSISLVNYITGTAQPKLNQAKLNNISIPLPSLSVQQEITSQNEAEQELVNANKKLITIYEQKIKDKISEVWGDSKK
jgi:type I restriction enzyme M protein